MHRSILKTLIDHAILICGTGFLILPVLIVVASSTHQSATLATEGLKLLPGTAGIANYTEILTLHAGFTDQITAIGMLKNSLILAIGVAVLTTGLSLIAAYGLVYFRFRAASLMFWSILVTLLLPLESRFITTFQVTNMLGLINTHTGMILPVISAALGTLFFRQLFLTLPEEYLEAAKLDGAGPVKFLFDFIIPLSARRAGAIFVVSFMIGWNQYLWPLMISTDESHYTLVRGIGFLGQASGPGMALVVFAILPPFLLVLVFQKWFFRGLTDP